MQIAVTQFCILHFTFLCAFAYFAALRETHEIESIL